MPIRPEMRHFYRTPEYRAQRRRVVERARDRCEHCRKPNGALVETHTALTCRKEMRALDLLMVWRPRASAKHIRRWRDQDGHILRRLSRVNAIRRLGFARRITVVCTMAHLDHDPAHNSDANTRFLCQWCHLHHDQQQHQETRARRKDAARPLLQEAL